MIDKLLTVDEVATVLGYHPESIRRLIRQGRMPFVRLGNTRNLRIRLEELEMWLKEGRIV